MATPVRTTSMLIARPTSFTLLEEAFTLARIVIPMTGMYWNKDSRGNFYRHLYSGLRECLEHPYHLYSHDTLDGREQLVAYVLLPR